jgi:hypothetical protein
MHEPSFGGTDGEPVIPRGDHPPYPPLSVPAGLIAKTAIMSGPPARTDFAGRMATSDTVLVLPTEAGVAR